MTLSSLFYLLGSVFLGLFLLTLLWEFASRMGAEKAPKMETVINLGAEGKKTEEAEWDPFKNLQTIGKNLEITSPEPARPEAPPRVETPKAEEAPPPSQAKEVSIPLLEEKEPGLPAGPVVEIEDPWKALMRESAKEAPKKAREISLDLETPSEDEKA